MQRLELDLLKQLNQQRGTEIGPDQELESRIESFELAFRMQNEAPDIQDITTRRRKHLSCMGSTSLRPRTLPSNA